MNRALSDVEELAMVAARKAGETPPQIAEAFDISRATVYNILGRHGVTLTGDDPTSAEFAQQTVLTLIERYAASAKELGRHELRNDALWTVLELARDLASEGRCDEIIRLADRALGQRTVAA